MQKLRLILLVICLAVVGAANNLMAAKVHEEIKGPFQEPSEVTKKCIECHDDAAVDIMRTQHWNWEQMQVINGKEMIYGKKSAMTNFAIAVDGNWPRCTSCHIGYGWEDASFDFQDKSKIDCLVCHDTTGDYKKAKMGAGMPKGFYPETKERGAPVDLLHVAQNVGKPVKKTCGTCHFGGCGAAKVKHGDLDAAFAGPSVEIDIHMAADGQDFDCQKCHYPQERHNIMGHYMVPTPDGTYQSGCIECHTDTPHRLKILNTHYEAVSCQACHIPDFARQYATKTHWDWCTTQCFVVDWSPEKYGTTQAVKGLGAFTWEKNVIPVYEWYNGNERAYMRGDKVDTNNVTPLNHPEGDITDKHSKIFPFRVHSAKQIYDKKYNYLITPYITGKGEAAFWKTYDWDTAARKGMAFAGLPYSGEYDFTETIMYWRINHGVVPGNKALDCLECHGNHGRMNWEQLGYKGDPWQVPGVSRGKHDFQ